ncbi:MAG: STAS domain-containing protein [Candidatus Eisenbacteria bacterium]
MNLKRREERGVVILDLEGKILGGEDSEALRREFERAIGARTPRVLVNLAEVPWLNSSGLGVLLSGYLRLLEKGGTVKFVNVQERVRGILITTKLVHVLEVFDDEKEAIDSFVPDGFGAADTPRP